jgi:isopenicillin N synthase-like dioxygenase
MQHSMARMRLPRQSSLTMSGSVAFTTVGHEAEYAAALELTLRSGFFQVTGHRVPLELQEAVLQNVKTFFASSKEEKELVHKGSMPRPILAAG